MSQINELIVLDEVDPIAIYQGDGMDEVIEKITKAATSIVPNIETAKGRKEIASLAAKVRKCKTYLDEQGKDIVTELKKQPRLIDAKRKYMRDTLTEVAEEVRQPLDEWEADEAARVAAHELAIRAMVSIGEVARDSWMTLTMDQLAASMSSVDIPVGDEWEEYETQAMAAHVEACALVRAAIEKKEKYDAEQAELKVLREAKEKQEQIDRDNKLKEDAATAERARVQQETERVERERDDAIKAEAEAKEDARLAEERRKTQIEVDKKAAELREKQAEEEQARAVKEAEERTWREQEQAIAEEKEKTEARAANDKHCAEVNEAAVDAIITLGLKPKDAEKVVAGIAKAMIPNVIIKY